ncbi:MAG: transporter [Spirochaetes bacterium]|nr:MAG: transporter [Spirochaetota bacterium]
MNQLRVVSAIAISIAALSLSARDVRAGKIQDNSFLIEEAYNQEAGVVQHIQTFQYMDNREWAYGFTQEWPVPGQAHQLSYSIPVYRYTAGDDVTGVGDILVNYRYQAVAREHLAFAPRLSAVLPTGDYKKGLGRGAPGLQANLPLSIELSDRWVTHLNAGLTFVRGAREPGGDESDILDYSAGAGVICLVNDNFNLMLEMVYGSVQTVVPGGGTTREGSFIVNPGMRFAINFESGLQIVPGAAFPVIFSSAGREYNVFVYLSFEHPLF